MNEPKDGTISVYRNPSDSNTMMMVFQCPITSQCNNDRCFWRQRDIHGLVAFPVWIDENGNCPLIKKNEEIREQYGDSIFPEFKISVSTNCMNIKCLEYIPIV